MRILRIKQAEAALAGGRLDEAREILGDAELRSHKQAQQLADRLVEALVARGAEHLAAGRSREALADCQKAADLGGNAAPAAELREQIAAALAGQRHRQRAHGDALTAARRQADAGRLTLAGDALADAAADSTRVGELRRELDIRRQAADRAIRRTRAAMDRGDLPAAADALAKARSERADDDQLADLSAGVVEACLAQARRELARGRIDLVETMLALSRRVTGRRDEAASPAATEIERAVLECRQAASAVRAGRMRQAGEALRRARRVASDAAWLGEAIDAADRAAQAGEDLRAGPVGMLTGPGKGKADLPEPVTVAVGKQTTTPVLSPVEGEGQRTGGSAPVAGAALSAKRMVMQLDGAGSSLVMLGRTVSVGPISSPGRPDLGLMADANLPIIRIERSEDGDYLLAGDGAVEVNDRPVTSKLLADGDKIALSPRCRLRFRLPTPASTTAVLELSTARLPQADIRRVILLDREMIVGPGPGAHVRADDLPGRAVLQPAGDKLLCRTDCAVTRGSRPIDPAEGIPTDCPVRIGPLGMVVTRA